jgi:hypothetical protein
VLLLCLAYSTQMKPKHYALLLTTICSLLQAKFVRMVGPPSAVLLVKRGTNLDFVYPKSFSLLPGSEITVRPGRYSVKSRAGIPRTRRLIPAGAAHVLYFH